MAASVDVGPLAEAALPDADRIFRLAFGTFLGLPDPLAFAGDADWVATRWRTDRDGAVGATLDGALVGSNFATRWGSFGFFGPLSVRPDLWDQGIARRLLDVTMERFAAWGVRHVGLFTFPHSPKHLTLYQRYGFWPRFLTPVMGKAPGPVAAPGGLTTFSTTPAAERAAWLDACLATTDAILPGLDVGREIASVDAQRLGDTIALVDGSRVDALAVLHVGTGSEAGGGTAYVKFGAVRPGAPASVFERLLDACEHTAAARGAAVLTAGVNLAHDDAARRMAARGFRSQIVGVALHRDNDPIYHRPGLWILDDWR